jgi:hypothetical protein
MIMPTVELRCEACMGLDRVHTIAVTGEYSSHLDAKCIIDVIIHILGSGTKSSRLALVKICTFDLFSRMLLSPVKRDVQFLILLNFLHLVPHRLVCSIEGGCAAAARRKEV